MAQEAESAEALNYDGEKRLFGAMVWGEALLKYRHIISPEIFRSKVAQRACSVYLKLFDKLQSPPKLPELIFALRQNVEDVEAELAVRFVERIKKMPRREIAKLYGDALEEAILTHHTHNVLMEAAEMVFEDRDAALAKAMSATVTVRPLRKRQSYSFEARKEAYLSGNPQGRGRIWKAPFSYMNAMTGGGFGEGETHLVGGDRGAGKTRGMINLARTFCHQGARVLYITYEMTEAQVYARLDQIITDLPSSEFANECDVCNGRGKIGGEPCRACGGRGIILGDEAMLVLEKETKRLLRKGGTFDVQKLIADSMSMGDLASYFRTESLEAGKFDVVVIDYDAYVKLPGGRDDIWVKQTTMYKQFNALCETEKVLGFIGSQTVKGGGTGGENSDFAGSSGKLDTVSSAWIIKPDKHNRNKVWWKNTKNRFGPDRQGVLTWASKRNGMLLSEGEEDPEEVEAQAQLAEQADQELLDDMSLAENIVSLDEQREKAKFEALDVTMRTIFAERDEPVVSRREFEMIQLGTGMEPREVKKLLTRAGWVPSPLGLLPEAGTLAYWMKLGELPPIHEQILRHEEGVPFSE